MLAGSVTRLAGQVEALEHACGMRPSLGAIGRADDHDLLERRLLLRPQLGAVKVVAPAARGRAEGEPRGLAGAAGGAGEVDDQPGLARGQQPGGQRAARFLEAARRRPAGRGRRAAAGATASPSAMKVSAIAPTSPLEALRRRRRGGERCAAGSSRPPSRSATVRRRAPEWRGRRRPWGASAAKGLHCDLRSRSARRCRAPQGLLRIAVERPRCNRLAVRSASGQSSLFVKTFRSSLPRPRCAAAAGGPRSAGPGAATGPHRPGARGRRRRHRRGKRPAEVAFSADQLVYDNEPTR